ncbi:MAG: type III-A CRISPR-associated protein Cas10/Csm1, partial [Candidatus Rifleibacteriota bacterium]
MIETRSVEKDSILKITLAAFLHDIGKFAQRAEGKKNNSGVMAFYPDEEFLNNQRQRLQPFNVKGQFYTHKHAIYTAAFIDHLEKILPECFQKTNWGGNTWIGDLAAGHHFVKRPDEDSYVKEWHNLERWIIAVADRMASALDREGFRNFEQQYNVNEEIANFKSARLWPIIEAVRFSQKAEKKDETGFQYRIPLKELRDDKFFAGTKGKILPPDNEEGAIEYRELFACFIEELKGLEQFKNNVGLWLEQFDNLYMRYAGQIPAATVSPAMQDVSLYDHSKITAALATALYAYHQETSSTEIEKVLNDQANKFLFIGACFNGIQKFIFASGGSTNKAAAKILRGRSFYVSLLSELIGDMLLAETGLPITSIVLNAAGQVTLIAPNLPRIREAIDRVKQAANNWLIDAYYGQTSVSFSVVEVSQKNISLEYRQMWHKLSRAMEQEKFCRFDLTRYGGTQTQFFQKFKPDLGVCGYCGQRPATDFQERSGSKSICGICKDQIEIGSKLVKSDAIAIWANDDNAFEKTLAEPLFGKYQVFIGKMGEAVDQAKKGRLLKIARLTASRNEPQWRKLAYKPIKGYVPVYNEEDIYLRESKDEEVFEGQIKSFETIAQAARKEIIPGEGKCGVAALGVLKADVDNLG